MLGLTILIVRRNVPESPRWLFIHGNEEEAEAIVDRVEEEIREETQQELEEPEKTIKVRQRKTIPFRQIARTAFSLYPKRAVLGLALFVGQAFIYNGVTFNLGTLFTTFYDVSSAVVPVFIIIYAIGNFLGPVTLGRLFDTVGRKPMIAGTYLGSAAVSVLLAVLFVNGSLGTWGFEALVVVTFFLASAGASAAYLTVSEIFPMETRALAIAFFYAVGTAVGGISGPLLFGQLIESGNRSEVIIAFLIGAGVMAIGGIAELLFGVKAEKAELEDIAQPLTAEEAEEGGGEEGEGEEEGVAGHEARAAEAEQIALAAEQRQRADERRRRTEERERRIAERVARRSREGRTGLRRFRPGPGSAMAGRGMNLTTTGAGEEQALDREIDAISRALDEHGETRREELARMVGARYWGPGRFPAAVREAVAEGRARRVSRATLAPPDGGGEDDGG